MKKLLVILFIIVQSYDNGFSQNYFHFDIDTVLVTVGNPNKVHVIFTKEGAHWESYVDSIGFESLNDTNNTQIINVVFKGCPAHNSYSYADTILYNNISYPFDLTVRAFMDTSINCPYIDSLKLMNTFHVPVSQITDVNEITNQQNNITVYPNPARQYVTVDIEKIKKNASISMYDIHGREVKNIETNQAKTTIDISDLPNGVYMMRLNLDGVIYTKRWSVVR